MPGGRMRKTPVVLASVTLFGYGAVALLIVLGYLFPGKNPDPAQWFYIPAFWYASGLCAFPLSFLCAFLTGITSFVTLYRANKIEWSGVIGTALLILATATLFSVATVLSGQSVIGGVHTTIALGIICAATLLLLPVLTLIALRPARTV